MRSTLLSMELERNGRKVDDPISRFLINEVITVLVADDGELLSVSGFDKIAAAIRRAFPPKVVAAIEPVAGERAMVAKMAAEWSGRITDFVGRELRVGEAYHWPAAFTLQNGEVVEYQVRTAIAELVPCATNPCARLVQTYDSDAAAAGELAGEVAEGAAASIGADVTAAELRGTRVSGSISRLIDPETMLIYDEILDRTLEATMVQEGEQAPMVQEEKKLYSFRFE